MSRHQLRAAGLTESDIDRAIAAARLFPVLRGVYALGYVPQQRKSLLKAATLACVPRATLPSGRGAVVSHGTAAALLGIWDYQPAEIDVIAPVEAGRKIPHVRRRHVPPPAADEVWIQDGIPCTKPGRTIVDITGLPVAQRPYRTSRERLVRDVLEQAAVARMLDIAEIDAVLDGPRRRGVRTLQRVLGFWRRYPAGLTVRSLMEAKLLPLLTEFAIPVPKVNNRRAVGSDGEERLEIDFAWPRARLVVETDGGRFHDNPEAVRRDARRNRNLSAAGFRVWRLTWRDVTQTPEATMHELQRLFRDPRRRPPAPAKRHP